MMSDVALYSCKHSGYGTTVQSANILAFMSCSEWSCMQVVKCEVAADGIQWSECTGRSSNFYVLKSKDAPAEVASKNKNVPPLIVIPNESHPVNVFTAMVLMLFVVLSPQPSEFLHHFFRRNHFVVGGDITLM